MKKALGLLTALLLALTGQSALAQNFPTLSGRVVDQANLLDPQQEAALTAKLQGLETRTKRQLVVATLSSLEGYEISDYGYRLGRQWALGQDGKGETEKDNGAILIVAPNERKMRIEVGYGLEPVLTDGLSSTIIRNDITPLFKAGDFAGGINAGVDRIVTVSDDEIAEAVRLYFRCCHTVAEGAGAAPLAALMQEREAMKGKRAGVILSGGNIDMPKCRSSMSLVNALSLCFAWASCKT